MTPDEQRVLAEALRLPSDARADLAERLLISVDAESGESVDQAWKEEIEKRARELDNGEVETLPWEEVRQRMRRIIDERAAKP